MKKGNQVPYIGRRNHVTGTEDRVLYTGRGALWRLGGGTSGWDVTESPPLCTTPGVLCGRPHDLGAGLIPMKVTEERRVKDIIGGNPEMFLWTISLPVY